MLHRLAYLSVDIDMSNTTIYCDICSTIYCTQFLQLFFNYVGKMSEILAGCNDTDGRSDRNANTRSEICRLLYPHIYHWTGKLSKLIKYFFFRLNRSALVLGVVGVGLFLLFFCFFSVFVSVGVCVWFYSFGWSVVFVVGVVLYVGVDVFCGRGQLCCGWVLISFVGLVVSIYVELGGVFWLWV